MSMGNLAKMAQQMQAEMARVQAEVEALVVEDERRRWCGQGGRQRQPGGGLDHDRSGRSSTQTTSRCCRT